MGGSGVIDIKRAHAVDNTLADALGNVPTVGRLQLVALSNGTSPDIYLRFLIDRLDFDRLIVPTLCVGMHPVTLCVTFQKRNAERPWRHSHAGARERSKLWPVKPVARELAPAGLRSSPWY